MTAEEHNRLLGIFHLVYGGLSTLLLLAVVIFLVFLFGSIANAPGVEPFPVGIFIPFMVFAVVLNALFVIPSFVAGYGLLKRKPWARVAGIIASVIDAMSVPLGTALCIYTLWFLFGEGGKSVYGEDGVSRLAGPQRGALGGAAAPAFDWQSPRSTFGREENYTPPQTPPDWRGR